MFTRVYLFPLFTRLYLCVPQFTCLYMCFAHTIMVESCMHVFEFSWRFVMELLIEEQTVISNAIGANPVRIEAYEKLR